MKKLNAVFILFLFVFPASGQKSKNKIYLTYAEGESYRSIYPLDITEVTGMRTAAHIYQGLVRLNPETREPEPCLAERWDRSDDGKTYRFYLRKGVFFHDNKCFPGGKGREVNSSDVKFCFEQLFTADISNYHYFLCRDLVSGGKEYYQNTKNGESKEDLHGFKVIDDFSFSITTTAPDHDFLYKLTLPGCYIYPREAILTYGKEILRERAAVGTGPFLFPEGWTTDSLLLLQKNPRYWESDISGKRLPYLDGIRIFYGMDQNTQEELLRKGDLDLIFPFHGTDIIGDSGIVKNKYPEYVAEKTIANEVSYYGFNHRHAPYNNAYLRKAINHAIDRDEICRKTFGQFAAPATGFVPPSVNGYSVNSVQAYEYDPVLARQYLVQAGYPGGTGLPPMKLQINTSLSSKNQKVAEMVQMYLKQNLNIDITIELMPFAQHLEHIEAGMSGFWRSGWAADYPSPQDFLRLFHSAELPQDPDGMSTVNSSRYSSMAFDSLFLEGKTYGRSKDFILADQTLIRDAAVVPLYYPVVWLAHKKNIRNLRVSPIRSLDLLRVYRDK